MFPYCPMMMMRSSECSCSFYPTQRFYPQQALDRSLELIKGALAGETEDQIFYEYLISVAPSQKDKEIIASIRDDEMKHYKMFRQMYCELTGMAVPEVEQEEFMKPRNYLEGLERALFGELGAVERYRQILFGLTERHQINMITEIITDELKHAAKYNFLYAENTR